MLATKPMTESLPGVHEETLEGRDVRPCTKCYLHLEGHETLEHPFRAEVNIGEPHWVANALTFATEDEAEAYVLDVKRRWTLVRDTRVVHVSTPLDEVIGVMSQGVQPEIHEAIGGGLNRNRGGENTRVAPMFDLDYRPHSYLTPTPHIDYPILAAAPGFGGGSFLPPLLKNEVEIAGLALRSTTGDVISVRARSVAKGIRYRIVDEYRTKFTIPDPLRAGPLSLGELIELMDSVEHEGFTGLVEASHEVNWEALGGKGDPARQIGFVTVISPLYRQLRLYYRERSRAWSARKQLERIQHDRERLEQWRTGWS